MPPSICTSTISAISLFGLIIIRVADSVGYLAAESTSFESKYSTEEFDRDDNYSIQVIHNGRTVDSTLNQGRHYGQISVIVNAFREQFILDLRLNRYLFAPNYIEKSVTTSGDIHHVVDQAQSHCYYIGTVRDRSESTTAAASTCSGLVGYFAIGNRTYHIDPLSTRLHGDHAIYRSRGISKSTHKCGSDGIVFKSLDNSAESKKTKRLKRNFNWPQDEDRKDKVLEIYVANSYSQFNARSRDINNVTQRTKDMINFASAIYQPLGIYWVLVGVEVWTESDKITIMDSDVDGALNSWYTYRKTKITPFQYNDNAVLITAKGFYNGVIGKAIIGAMCSNQFSGAIISDVRSSVSAVGSTVAHEVGHCFGLGHDSDSCPCVDKGGRCVMYPSSNAGAPATNWSQCSIDQFTVSFQKGKDACLYNVPEVTYQPSSNCGNGIVESGEDCDCGKSSSRDCNSNCCNSTTCKLIGSAECAYGRCCDESSCKIFPADKECRSRSGDCDLAEFCTGSSGQCPTDTYKPDGTNCTTDGRNDASYCYKGRCRSHLSQCQLLWGEGTTVSADRCYYMFNVYGLHYGNCGMKWLPNVTYIPCDRNDAYCGKLQCEDNSKSLASYPDSYYLLSTASIGDYTCHSVIIDLGLQVQDPGLVPDGAKCGEGKMCVSQKCVEISVLPNTKPSCSGSCAENEFCNNAGFCQSLSGASGLTGGKTERDVGLIVGLCILFLLIVPLLVVGAVLLYVYRLRLAKCVQRKRSSGVGPVTAVGIYHISDSKLTGSLGHTNRGYPTRPAPPIPPSAYPAPPMAWDHNLHLSTYEPEASAMTPSQQNALNNNNHAVQQQRGREFNDNSSGVNDGGRPRPPPKPRTDRAPVPHVRTRPPIPTRPPPPQTYQS